MQLMIKSGADAGRAVPVPNGGRVFTIGRNGGCDLVLSDTKASSRHVTITLEANGTATLNDLASTNGTYVNGQRVQAVMLAGGEQIQIGDTVMTFGAAPNAVDTGTPAPGRPAAAPPTGPPLAQGPPQQPATPGAPSSVPVQRPSRTYSAIQRMQVIKSTRRATYVGLAVLVAVLIAVGLGVAGVYGGGGSNQKDLATVVDNVKNGIVYVRTETPSEGRVGRGTAWVWDLSNGHVVTNAHVTDGAETIAVGVNGEVQPAQLVGQATCEDLAVLKVADTRGLTQMKTGAQGALKIGTPVAAIGYPAGVNESRDFNRFDLTGTDGTVSIVQTSQGPFENIIATTAQINAGQSGGPLVNFNEEVVGVTTRTEFDATGGNIENGAIGIDRVKEIVPRIAAGDQVC